MPEFEQSKQHPRLLIVSNDIVDAKMAGPGMRYLEMARALSPDIDVTLAIPAATTLDVPGVCLVQYHAEDPKSLRALVEQSDITLLSGNMAERFPFLQHTSTRLVVDLYDPFVLENLHYYINEPISDQESINDQMIDITNRLARLGDFFICGSERQRDFWMGVLTANRRINPHTFSRDPTLHSLIDVVGIGFPTRAPRHRPMLRGVHPAFPDDARIILWGGGLWDWLDPLTLVRAWLRVLARHPKARLVFLGTRHPNPLVPRHKMAEQTETLATEIGEKDRTIFFFEWLPYEDREALLCEADIGVTLHPLHIEMRYAIRTRVLDYFWARLPVLASDGDVTSEWIRQYGLGQVVPPLDVDSAAKSLGEMLQKPREAWAPAFEPLQEVFSWTRVVEPLRRYCLQGGYAPDREKRDEFLAGPNLVETLRGQLARARYIWRTEGLGVLLHRVWRHLQWRLVQPF
jgi:glycosyltransferase involved in cell wall biosynthesis